MGEVKIGMVGMDTSHSRIFASLLNDPSQPLHVPGGKLICGYPGGSPDVEISRSRVGSISAELRDNYGVTLLDSVEEVAERSDAILLTSVDGRVHREQFKVLAPFGKPVFIDKPLAFTSRDAESIAALAARYNVAFFSSSMVRFGSPFTAALNDGRTGTIIGADCSGPLELQEAMPGLFWYGIHTAELLYAALGEGCRSVRAVRSPTQECIIGVWADGRIGTLRGNRAGGAEFYALLHRERGSGGVNVLGDCYNGGHQQLLTRFIAMAEGAPPPVPASLTLELIRFLEAANESRESGETVWL